MLNKITMKKGSNPVTLFEQIASVENQYNTVTRKIPEEELIAVVLDKSTMDYKATSILTTEQRVKGTLATLEDLKSAINQHWRQIGRNNEAEKSNKISLAVVNGIICFKCGKKGHKASVCPENNKSENAGSNKQGQGSKNKEKRKCYWCGKVGHIAPNCWEDEKNASKRLANWKLVNEKRSETVAAVVNSGNKVEYLLCGMDMCFLTSTELLNDPNV